MFDDIFGSDSPFGNINWGQNPDEQPERSNPLSDLLGDIAVGAALAGVPNSGDFVTIAFRIIRASVYAKTDEQQKYLVGLLYAMSYAGLCGLRQMQEIDFLNDAPRDRIATFLEEIGFALNAENVEAVMAKLQQQENDRDNSDEERSDNEL